MSLIKKINNSYLYDCCFSSRVAQFFRVLAFSISPIKTVEAQLDDGAWLACKHTKGPLFTTKWNSTEYSEGIHTIRVE